MSDSLGVDLLVVGWAYSEPRGGAGTLESVEDYCHWSSTNGSAAGEGGPDGATLYEWRPDAFVGAPCVGVNMAWSDSTDMGDGPDWAPAEWTMARYMVLSLVILGCAEALEGVPAGAFEWAPVGVPEEEVEVLSVRGSGRE